MTATQRSAIDVALTDLVSSTAANKSDDRYRASGITSPTIAGMPDIATTQRDDILDGPAVMLDDGVTDRGIISVKVSLDKKIMQWSNAMNCKSVLIISSMQKETRF